MSNLSKKIILDELIENSHVEKVEDVIFWALEKYYKEKNTNGSLVAYAIVQRIKDAEKEGEEEFLNPSLISDVFSNYRPCCKSDSEQLVCDLYGDLGCAISGNNNENCFIC